MSADKFSMVITSLMMKDITTKLKRGVYGIEMKDGLCSPPLDHTHCVSGIFIHHT